MWIFARLRSELSIRAGALLLAAGLAATPAGATPNLREAIDFARTTWIRLCSDKNASRFAEIGADPAARVCRAWISPGAFTLEIELRGGRAQRGAGIAGHSNVRTGLRHEARFDSRAHFFCSDPNRDGFATLYMTCLGHFDAASERCAVTRYGPGERDAHLGDQYERSFVDLIRVRQRPCETLRRAFSFIADRSRQLPESDVERFFSP